MLHTLCVQPRVPWWLFQKMFLFKADLIIKKNIPVLEYPAMHLL